MKLINFSPSTPLPQNVPSRTNRPPSTRQIKNGQTTLVPKTDTRRTRPGCRNFGAKSPPHHRHLPKHRQIPAGSPHAINHIWLSQSSSALALGMHLCLRQTYPAMLRICYSQQWTLCGQLAGPWVQELRSCWEHARRAAVGSSAVVDLSDVTFVDENGERLLAEMRNAGVEFVATGVETKHLLQNLKSKGERPLRRLIGYLTEAATPRSSGAPDARLRPLGAAARKKRDSPCRTDASPFDLSVEEDARLAEDITKDITKRE
jgi:hypothetical protein